MNRYALLVGINDYGEDSGISPLRCAEADARRMAGSLDGVGFKTHLLVGADATREAVLRFLDRETSPWLHGCDEDDLFLFYFAGHGETIRERRYLHPHGARVGTHIHSIPIEDLFELIQTDWPCRNVLGILDACQSELRAGARGAAPATEAVARNIQNVTGGMARRTRKSTWVLFGCDQGECSYEDLGVGHGILTWHLAEQIDGWNGEGGLAFDEVCRRLGDRVHEHAQRLFSAPQSPRLFSPLTTRVPLLADVKPRPHEDGTWSIRIVESFDVGGHPAFLLDVQGPRFPRVVGCSLRTPDGRINDLPGQRIRTAGKAVWRVKIPDTSLFVRRDAGEPRYSGEVTFALWHDDGFLKRLTDTGWIPWSTGDASGLGTSGNLAKRSDDFANTGESGAWESGPGAEVSIRMSVEEATAHLVNRAVALGRRSDGTPSEIGQSSSGTQGYVLDGGDGKSALYCHGSGDLRGMTFLVGGGIGWCYRTRLGGATGFLGLPVSDERQDDGGARSIFEGGYVDWRRDGSVLRAYRVSGSRVNLELELQV
ncbi:MAG: caspase family protein [Pseudomonadota bacterium]